MQGLRPPLALNQGRPWPHSLQKERGLDSCLTYLSAVAQKMIREHNGEHRFPYWDGPDAHTGVVAAAR